MLIPNGVAESSRVSPRSCSTARSSRALPRSCSGDRLRRSAAASERGRGNDCYTGRPWRRGSAGKNWIVMIDIRGEVPCLLSECVFTTAGNFGHETALTRSMAAPTHVRSAPKTRRSRGVAYVTANNPTSATRSAAGQVAPMWRLQAKSEDEQLRGRLLPAGDKSFLAAGSRGDED